MLHCMILSGSVIFENPNGYLPGKPVGVRSKDPWTLGLWCEHGTQILSPVIWLGIGNTFVIV